MAKELTKWQSDDGKIYDSEIDALYADLEIWKQRSAGWQKRALEAEAAYKTERDKHESRRGDEFG